MHSFSPLLAKLVQSLCILPGVGQKSAQRMALTLLEKKPEKAKDLAVLIQESLENLGRCSVCRTITEYDTCPICTNANRDQHLLCVTQTPMDLISIEQGAQYNGLYFVLMGLLSPLDGVGPEDLGLEHLEARLKSGVIKELILAINPTIEGEATMHFLLALAKKYQVPTSRIAYGVPFGGELEYVDAHTLNHAFSSREKIGQ